VGLNADTSAQPGAKYFASKVKLLRWLLDEWLSQFMGKSLPTLRICESSYYNLVADPASTSFAGFQWLAHLVGKLLPPADLWILLEPSTEGLQSIGQQSVSSQALKQFATYRLFLSSRKRYVSLNASKPSAAVAEDVYAAIIDTLAERADKQLKIRFK
jgi:hypothetical protein